MILKKFYGNTIREALKDAKEQLGEEVILLESVPPEEDRPASVTVMLDQDAEPEPEAAPSEDEGFRNVLYKRSDVMKQARRGEAPSKSSEPREEQESAQSAELRSESKQPEPQPTLPSESEERTPEKPKEKSAKTKGPDLRRKKAARKPKVEFDEDDEPTPEDQLPEPKGMDAPSASMSRHKQSLIEIPNEPPPPNSFFKGSSVSREVSALHRRFDQVESMLSEALISANLDYASHEAFQQLLDTGIRTTTISGWFKQILNKGVDPYEDRESFMYELAKIVRDAITITLPNAVQPNLVFVGPSGSGKTSLIMKLAGNPDFFGEKKVALVSVEPRNAVKRYTTLGLFAEEHQLDYFTARDGIDVSKLMPKLVHYDHVLFDTPSISLEKKTAFREYWKIRQILASVMPLEVHFVINATMENYYFREAYATNHPLQPDYVAITHLDETRRWGHLIPFLKTLGCSVRYMTQGAAVPDDIDAFSPTWFAESILSNNSTS